MSGHFSFNDGDAALSVTGHVFIVLLSATVQCMALNIIMYRHVCYVGMQIPSHACLRLRFITAQIEFDLRIYNAAMLHR